jgi:hypothetical protein
MLSFVLLLGGKNGCRGGNIPFFPNLLLRKEEENEEDGSTKVPHPGLLDPPFGCWPNIVKHRKTWLEPHNKTGHGTPSSPFI